MMEYARDVVRAYHYYSITGEFRSPETLLKEQRSLVPYDSEGNAILYEDDPTALNRKDKTGGE